VTWSVRPAAWRWACRRWSLQGPVWFEGPPEGPPASPCPSLRKGDRLVSDPNSARRRLVSQNASGPNEEVAGLLSHGRDFSARPARAVPGWAAQRTAFSASRASSGSGEQTSRRRSAPSMLAQPARRRISGPAQPKAGGRCPLAGRGRTRSRAGKRSGSRLPRPSTAGSPSAPSSISFPPRTAPAGAEFRSVVLARLSYLSQLPRRGCRDHSVSARSCCSSCWAGAQPSANAPLPIGSFVVSWPPTIVTMTFGDDLLLGETGRFRRRRPPAVTSCVRRPFGSARMLSFRSTEARKW